MWSGHRVYEITTKINANPDNTESDESVSVYKVNRRYSDFEHLFTTLVDKCSHCIIPPLPRKTLYDKVVHDNS